MEFSQFREEIKRTHSKEVDIPSSKFRLTQGVVGLVTESAELLDSVKKHIFQHRELDRVNMVEELGDLMHYFAIVMNELDLSMDKVLDVNIEKLKLRYKGGFSSEASEKRELDKERSLLESKA